jgi:hypothetical protein
MSLRSGWRFSKNNWMGRLESCRPQVQLLEDRLPPGQVWLGDALAGSLLGPAFTALQFNATDGVDVTSTPIVEGAASSEAWLLPLADTAAAPVQILLAASAQTQSETSIVVPATSNDSSNTDSSGTTGWGQDADLAGLALAARRKAPLIVTSQVGSSQPSGNDYVAVTPGNHGTGQVVQNSSLTTGTAVDTSLNGVPPGFADMVTAPSPQGTPNDGRDGTPPDHGPLNSVVGPNNIANDHTPCPNGQGVIQSETAVATSGSTVVVGYNDFRGFYCPGNGFQVSGWAYSTDRGRTFTDGHSLPGGTSQRGDPWLVTGPDGSIYYSSLWNGTNAMDVIRGTVDPNTGLVSWSNPTVITGGSFDKESMSIDPNSGGQCGTLYVTYTRLGSGIYLYKSTDCAQTFQGPFVVRSAGNVTGSVSAVGPNGELYVTWDIGYPSDSGIGFAVSTNGGQSFTVSTQIQSTVHFVVSGTDRAPQFPHIAVDTSGGPNTGNIYITWQSAAGGNGNAFLTRSTDGGQSWSTPLKINDDATTAIHWYPTVSVDSNGYVHSFFYDRRDNPGTTLTNVYYARSTDGGQTFEPNIKVTDVTSNFHTFSDGTPAWGDYINSVADGPSVVASWADGRLNDPDAFFARVGSR